MKTVKGKFNKVEDNKNLNGKEFSAVIEHKTKKRVGPKEPTNKDLLKQILVRVGNLETVVKEHTVILNSHSEILNRHSDIFKRNKLK
ncbi:MAG: hypothetical protein LBE13_19655 [Bacteroidales bacterium]|jgi:hypothetical protein|nr:hypothetical protein [Bacteroidales bacterium]